MVEKAHTAAGTEIGWWPSVAAPLRNVGHKLADFFALHSEASQAEDIYEISVELPGVKSEDVDVSVHDHLLTVKGEKRSSREETGRHFFFSERQYGAFMRSFRLPADVDEKAIEADFDNGVLTLRAPKTGNADEARRIEVKSA